MNRKVDIPLVTCNYPVEWIPNGKTLLPSDGPPTAFRRRLAAFAVGQIFSQAGIEKYAHAKVLWTLTDLLCDKIQYILNGIKYFEESTLGTATIGGFRLSEVWEDYLPEEAILASSEEPEENIEEKLSDHEEDEDIDALFQDFEAPKPIEEPPEELKHVRLKRPLHYNRMIKSSLIMFLGALCAPPLSSQLPLGRGLGRGDAFKDLIYYSRLQKKWMTSLLRKLGQRVEKGETKLLIPEALLTILKNCPVPIAASPPVWEPLFEFSLDELSDMISKESLELMTEFSQHHKFIRPISALSLHKQTSIPTVSIGSESTATITGNFHPEQYVESSTEYSLALPIQEPSRKDYFFGLDSSSKGVVLPDLNIDALMLTSSFSSLPGALNFYQATASGHPYTLSRLATPVIQSLGPSPFILSPWNGSNVSLPSMDNVASYVQLEPSLESTLPVIQGSKFFARLLEQVQYYVDSYPARKEKNILTLESIYTRKSAPEISLVDYELSIAKLYVRELVFQKASRYHVDSTFILNVFMGSYPISARNTPSESSYDYVKYVFRLFSSHSSIYETIYMSGPLYQSGLWPSSSYAGILPQYADVGVGLCTWQTGRMSLLQHLSESCFEYFGYRSNPFWFKELADYCQILTVMAEDSVSTVPTTDDIRRKYIHIQFSGVSSRKTVTSMVTPATIHRVGESDTRRIEKLSLTQKLKAKTTDDSFESLMRPQQPTISNLKIKLNAAAANISKKFGESKEPSSLKLKLLVNRNTAPPKESLPKLKLGKPSTLIDSLPSHSGSDIPKIKLSLKLGSFDKKRKASMELQNPPIIKSSPVELTPKLKLVLKRPKVE